MGRKERAQPGTQRWSSSQQSQECFEESVILLHILLSFISIFSPNAWCQGTHLSSPSTLPLLFLFACICGLCSLGCSLVSGRRVVLEPPRTRQGHIFPTVVANGANGKTNCLKFCEGSFWGRVWINYSVAAALCRRASSSCGEFDMPSALRSLD